MAFRVGQKVVCKPRYGLGGSGMKRPAGSNYPTPGDIYHIRQLNDWASYVLVLLEEVNNEHMLICNGGNVYGSIEPGFDSRHFEPIVETKTDISIFTEMLKPRQRELIGH